MKNAGYFLVSLSILLSVSCQKAVEQEGFVEVEGGKIWYKIVGEGDGIPLVILHGGPGSRSCAMIPGFSLLGKDRPVIFYDQLGSGNSDRPTDTILWKTERFVNEIDYLRKALKLDQLHLLGHSCGSTFLIEYMITKKPAGVESVIFSSPHISTPHWMADAKILISNLPKRLQDTIAKYEALKDFTHPQYLAATDSFYLRHLSRTGYPNLPDEKCDNEPGFNHQVYNYMWGPTEFTVTGTLKDFDRSEDLHQISEPILFVTGEYDEARPETMYEFQKLSNSASVAIIEGAAHMTMIDQPQQLAKVISEFLKNVEDNK